jgi:hypothetical protein
MNAEIGVRSTRRCGGLAQFGKAVKRLAFIGDPGKRQPDSIGRILDYL